MEKTIERTQGDFYHLQVFFLAEKTRIQLYNRFGFQLVDCTVDKLTVRVFLSRTGGPNVHIFNLLLLIESNT